MYCQVWWWPILEIGPLHLTHPSAHTQQWVVNTHTHCEHTPGAVGSHCSSARGAVGGSVPCSRAPQLWYRRGRECCSFTIPTFNPCRTWDSNPQPLDYKSDSLTTRPQLPHSRVIATLFAENIYLIYITIFKYIFHIKFWSYGPLIIVITILTKIIAIMIFVIIEQPYRLIISKKKVFTVQYVVMKCDPGPQNQS